MVLDLDFYESIIIYNCLKKGNEEYLASCIEYLEPSIFNNTDISKLIGIISKFYLDTNAVPNLTEIKAKIIDSNLKESYLNIIKSFKTLDRDYNLSELVKNTETFIKQRLLCKCLEESAQEKISKKIIDEARALKEFDKIASISLIDNLGMEFLNETDEFCAKLEQTDSFISTGYEWLDKEFGGGLFKEGKCIYCIAGETNIGKSIVLANIGTNILLQGLNVVIITLEMSEFRYAKRIASMMTGIAMMDLVSKKDEFVEFVTKVKDRSPARLFIKEYPTKQVSAKHVAGYLKKLERQKGFHPDIIILDYHTLLKSSIPQGSKHGDMQYITQESRALSYIFNAPVLSAAQFNRSDGNLNSPDLNRIAGSWDMLSDVDYLVSIWQTDEDREAEIIRWILKKARDSARNVDHFWNVDYQTLKLTESSDNRFADNSVEIMDIIDDLDLNVVNEVPWLD